MPGAAKPINLDLRSQSLRRLAMTSSMHWRTTIGSVQKVMESYCNVIRCFIFFLLHYILLVEYPYIKWQNVFWAEHKATLDIRERVHYLVIIKSKIHYSFL